MPLSLEEKVRLLSMVDVFEALSEEELERLAHFARDATYEPGEILPEPQQGGEKLYVLKEGRVQLYVMLPNEGEITLSVVGGKHFRGDSRCRSGIREGTRPSVGTLFGVHPKDGDSRATRGAKPSSGPSHSTHAKR